VAREAVGGQVSAEERVGLVVFAGGAGDLGPRSIGPVALLAAPQEVIGGALRRSAVGGRGRRGRGSRRRPRGGSVRSGGTDRSGSRRVWCRPRRDRRERSRGTATSGPPRHRPRRCHRRRSSTSSAKKSPSRSPKRLELTSLSSASSSTRSLVPRPRWPEQQGAARAEGAPAATSRVGHAVPIVVGHQLQGHDPFSRIAVGVEVPGVGADETSDLGATGGELDAPSWR
jgi:hypothetical protein